MMDTDEDPPPSSTDLDGWRLAVKDGRFRDFKMEFVIAAIQDLGPKTDESILGPLVLHASETILRILHAMIGKKHPNEGNNIIERAHDQLIEAVLNPKCRDGEGLRHAFVPRVRFRATDAIRAETKHEERERTHEASEDLQDERSQRETDPRQELIDKLYVEDVLRHVTDERKRLAFWLFMEGTPLESKRTASISGALGVSAKTATKWIEEVQSQLREIIGERP